jgi:hypothetical protein
MCIFYFELAYISPYFHINIRLTMTDNKQDDGRTSALEHFCVLFQYFEGRQYPNCGHSPSLCVQTGPVALSTSRTVGTGGPFLGGKARPERDANHSPASSAEIKTVEAIPLPPPPKRFFGV